VPLKDLLKEESAISGSTSGGARHSKQDQGGTCFCLVGKACVERKRDHITKEVKSRYWWDRTHNYGNLLPKAVNQALWIDNKETGTDFWQMAIGVNWR
jgi:hypothetical protein